MQNRFSMKIIWQNILGPSFSEERAVDLVCLHSSHLSNDRSKDVVLNFGLLPPEDRLFSRSRYTARNGLVDVNVLDTAFVLVMLDEQIDAERDDPTRDPANALELKDGVDTGVGEGFVL